MTRELELALTRILASEGTDQHWIGVDLDGTLAEYDGWKGDTVIGAPIPAMVARVHQWISEGKQVRIFTARAHDIRPEAKRAIEMWCEEHIGVILPITCIKDRFMTEFWDDKAIGVKENTGEPSAVVAAVGRINQTLQREITDVLYKRGIRFPTTRHRNTVMPAFDGDDLPTVRFVLRKFGFRPIRDSDPAVERYENGNSLCKLYHDLPRDKVGFVLA